MNKALNQQLNFMQTNKFKDQSLVSVIMNCYNGETYLTESIKSVINQTYKNWELIFWDNRSTDKSAEIFKSFDDPRLKYFQSEEHTTLYLARDLAIKKTKGEFIAFLDTDDWWYHQKLEKQLTRFNKDNIGLVFSNLFFYYQKSGKKKIFSKKKLYTGSVRNKIIKDYQVGLQSVIIRKKAYVNAPNGFDSKYNIIGDFDFFVRLSESWNFDCVQEPLAYYRIHDKNFSDKNIDLEINELKYWHDKYIANNFLNKSESNYLISNIEYLKCKKLISKGKRLNALFGIFLMKNISFKIKLLLRILLPNFLIIWFQKF